MIRGFANRETERVSRGDRSRSLPPDIQPKAFKLLRLMAEADDWNELRNPTGNRLHALSGDRAGQYAIRINQQWRIAFRPVDGAFADVEITDYH